MGTTTKVREFLHGVSTTLMDMQPQFARYGQTELVRYTNMGQRAVAKYLPMAGARVDTIKLVAGPVQNLTKVPTARIIPGDGSSAADTYGIALIELMHNMGSSGNSPGLPITVADHFTLNTIDPGWVARTGTSVREYLFDKATPLVFEVTPAPGPSDNVWVRMRWMVEPPKIPEAGTYGFDEADTTLIGLPDQYLDDLHNYVVAMALLKGSKNVQNIPKSQYHAGLFTSSINAQALAITGVSPNLKQLPFAEQVSGS